MLSIKNLQEVGFLCLTKYSPLISQFQSPYVHKQIFYSESFLVVKEKLLEGEKSKGKL